MSTSLRRSARLVANDVSSSHDSQPLSCRELARRRAAAMPPRQLFVFVEKEDSFDVMLSPNMGPFGVLDQDAVLRPDAVNNQTTHHVYMFFFTYLHDFEFGVLIDNPPRLPTTIGNCFFVRLLIYTNFLLFYIQY